MRIEAPSAITPRSLFGIARIFTVYYFAFFLVILPVLGKVERTKPLPNSIAESVLAESKPIGAPAPPPAGAKV